MATTYQLSKRYHIFISHVWEYDENYNTIINWLNDSDLHWKKYSVPDADPLNLKPKEVLTKQITSANIVLIVCDMYYPYSFLLDYQIDEAVRMKKVIIGIKPYGQHKKIPLKIQENVAVMVDWNSNALIGAIKTYG